MSNVLSVFVNGITGKVGNELTRLLAADSSLKLAGGLSNESRQDTSDIKKLLLASDLVLDFSAPDANQQLHAFIKELPTSTKLAILIGTTGLNDAQKKNWSSLGQTHKNIRILNAPNTSVGVLVASQAAKILAKLLGDNDFDIEITETHHRNKKDAPSGTALFLANSIVEEKPHLKINTQRQGARVENEIGVAAVRGGGVFGEHEVRFIGDHEEVKISHRAFSRSLFAQGALVMGRWLVSKPAGFYNLKDVDL